MPFPPFLWEKFKHNKSSSTMAEIVLWGEKKVR